MGSKCFCDASTRRPGIERTGEVVSKEVNLTPMERRFLSLMFKDLSMRHSEKRLISKTEFFSFATTTGLWTEHLIKKLHLSDGKVMNEKEFLEIVCGFSKGSTQEVVARLFLLCCEKDSSMITRPQFVKMILNFPEIQMKNEAMESCVISPSANIKQIAFTTTNVEVIDVARGPSDAGFQCSISKAVTQSSTSIDEESLTLAKTGRGNQAKNWANAQFTKFSERGEMDLRGFAEFCAMNRELVKSFREDFQSKWWLESPIGSSKQTQLGFQKMRPLMSCQAKFFSKELRVPTNGKVEIHRFLLLFFGIGSEMPERIALLKNLHFEFLEILRTVQVRHPSPSYKGFELSFESDRDFEACVSVLREHQHEEVTTKYRIKYPIGQGMSSVVYLAYLKSDSSQKFSVKKIDKEKLSPEQLIITRSELQILALFNHPNILKSVETFETPTEIFNVLEYFEGRDLYEFIMSKPACRLPEMLALNILKILLVTVDHIHLTGIIHRDLKSENIMIRVSPDHDVIEELKVIDFGFATFIEESAESRSVCGTDYYAAPEICSGNYDQRADIFSLGVIFYFMLAGGFPIVAETSGCLKRMPVLTESSIGNIPNLSSVCSGSKELLLGLTAHDPDQRLSIAKALENPVFSRLI